MGITRHLSPALIRDLAETHPRLQPVMRRLTDDLRIERPRALALLRSLVTHAIEDLGDSYLGQTGRRLRRIEQIRGRIAESIDSVVEHGELPHDLDRAGLGRLFDDLQREMEGLQSPGRFAETHAPDPNVESILAGIGPEGETGRPLPTRLAPDPSGRPLPGQHTPSPPGVLRDAMQTMRAENPARAAVFERVLAEQGDHMGLAVLAETESAQQSALRAAIEAMETPLTDVEQAHLRAAVEELGRARHRAAIGPGTATAHLRAERIAGLPEPLRTMAINDNTVLGPLAEMDPVGLRQRWDAWQAGNAQGNFRDYAYREMRSHSRPYQAEFQAASDVAQQHGVSLLKDPATYDPTEPNMRRINPREGGTDLVGLREDGEIWYIDDKSHRGRRQPEGGRTPIGVSEVSAFEGRALPRNMLDDASEMEGAIARIQAAGGTPDPRMVEAVARIRACGQRLNDMTVGWSEADFLKIENQQLIRAVLGEHRIKLNVTSTMGDVRWVTDRLEGLGIDVLPPFARRP